MPEPHVTTIPPAAAHDEPALEFPGCRPVRMSRDDIERSERRIEYWDAATETAMICDPVSVYHEHPGQRLRELATRIAQLRGSPIEAFGAADLLLRDAQGAWRRILEGDQTVYLHPRTTRPEGARIEVGSDTLPDVVLEVDNTTDVRRGKLSLYESWGFPEVWVEVPDKSSPSRPAGLRPGLTIHLLEGGAFRRAARSRAFAGWTAAEIHRALNEPELSQATLAALRRVGRALGAAEGTGPDDDPQLRAERRESRAQGHAEGHAAGHAEGLVEGATEARVETRRDAVLQVLRLRGLPVSAALPRRLAELQPASTAALVQAALECRDEAHFLRMIGQPRP
ncbi:MAG: hypothetical protein OXP69_14075 [Spirochaetaceae bacterium]|nr:hypothetical protein [Spirochaetaceae bacterium]